MAHSILHRSFRRGMLATLLSLSALSALAHVANEPAPRTDPGWVKRQELLNQRVAEAGKTAKVLFIGDSITEAWEYNGKDVWARYYESRGAVNIGIGGDQTQHVLWRLDHGNLNGLNPKAAVIMIGTNNVGNSYGNGSTVPQIAEGVAAIVQKLRDKLPQMRILLLGIFPRGSLPNPMRGDLLQVNQIIKKLADGQNVIYLDFGDRFLDRDGSIPTSLMPDYLHLTPAGYQIWAESIEAQLSSLLGDAKR